MSIVTAIGIAGVSYAYSRNSEVKYDFTPMQIANLEALRSDPEEPEGDPDYINCWGMSIKNDNAAYIDCSTCSRVAGWQADGPIDLCDRNRP